MGKQKRERRKPHKENPTGLLSVKDFDKESEDTHENRELALQRVYEEVQSSNVEEKISGLQTLESMSHDPNMAMKIAKCSIGKVVGPLLVDPNIPVRAATANALRCIVENGGPSAYASLLKDDIMTPLSALLKNYFKEWQPKFSTKKGESRIKDEKETLTGAVILLWTLCENNESVIKYSNEEDLAPILMRFFDIATYGIEIGVVAAQCLLTLSEDNPTALKRLKECQSTLIRLLSLEVTDSLSISEVVPLKTVVAGLLTNMLSHLENDATNVVCKIISVLSETLEIDHKIILSNFLSTMTQEKNGLSHNAKKKILEARKIFGAQQQALEIIANLCSEDQDDDIDSDMEDSDATEGESECMDLDSSNEKTFKTPLPIELVEVIDSCNLIKKIWDKTEAIKEPIKDTLMHNLESKSLFDQIHTLRCRAYFCLNNLISSLDIEVLGGMDHLYRVWKEIGEVVFKETNSNDIELLESATAAMRASLQKLAESKTNIFHKLTQADIQPMLNGEQQCPNPNVRANLIRILGILAFILINNSTQEGQGLAKQISIFLFNICTTESEVWVMAESLDAIMDIYAEDETNQCAVDVELIENLQRLVPIFKNKLRQQRKTLGDNASIVFTVNSNVQRFIKYKQKHLNKPTLKNSVI